MSRFQIKMEILDSILSREIMLTGPTNFKVWQSTLKSIFKREDLWDIVGGHMMLGSSIIVPSAG